MNVLVFDTETTGLPNKGREYGHPDQPYLVQLGALLYDSETGRTRAELNLIINPLGEFKVPDGAAAVHDGIATPIAETYGVPLVVALGAFHHLSRQADAVVAHNIDFDLAIMGTAYERAAKRSVLHEKKLVCTMAALAPIMRLPPTERMIAAGMGDKFKSPSLREASEYIGRPPFDAHDAMADVRECLAVWHWLESQNHMEAA